MHTSINDIKTELKMKREIEICVAIDAARQKVLDSFSRIDPQTNHNMSRKLRHPNTGLWFLQSPEFQSWMNSESARLWLYGIPGAGKTVLASLIIDELLAQSSPSIAIAYFYCDYKSTETQETHSILSCLAQQIAKQDESSFVKLQKFYETHNRGRESPVDYNPQDLCDLIINMAGHYDHTVIVVDGLDERGQNAGSVTEFITSLNSVRE